jgi:hypothetical protein
MCRNYDRSAVDQCTEDDAERVREKEQLNFCDWFVAGEGAFDAARSAEQDAAAEALDALFGGSSGEKPEEDPARTAAEALFGSELDS